MVPGHCHRLDLGNQTSRESSNKQLIDTFQYARPVAVCCPVRNKDLIRLPIISYLAFQRATNNWI